MKILDIRKTEQGWVADVLWSDRSVLPISIVLDEVTDASLSEYQERLDMEALNEIAPKIVDGVSSQAWFEAQKEINPNG